LLGETRSTLTSHQYSQVELEEDKAISIVSADIEFYYFMNTLLKSGEILDIADVHKHTKILSLPVVQKTPQFQEEI